ncbi:type IV pilus twitching motility protein PilT [Leucobacter allii]|uniref:type IV pilus twitching motility protein PilT n=1 Tax=Leucobacter allii TaxID=2932247 RepID=UPI001FD4476F|nr:type IV pilus twitching motility protein PilT [Leucobacter allii]UOR03325.1 type IV pilus twitching motility protein PilT [Leucobacter allii]
MKGAAGSGKTTTLRAAIDVAAERRPASSARFRSLMELASALSSAAPCRTIILMVT